MVKTLNAELFYSKLSHPQFLKRVKDSKNKKQPFRKAFGSFDKNDLIVDATVGFGQDLLCLASWGVPVIGFERDKKVFQFINDALNKLKDLNEVLFKICSNIELRNENSIEGLRNLKSKATHIYLDPIYPQKEKSALGKLDLRILKDQVGEDSDSSELFDAAFASASKRVILKRPLKEEKSVSNSIASLEIKGSSTRYDVYLVKNIK